MIGGEICVSCSFTTLLSFVVKVIKLSSSSTNVQVREGVKKLFSTISLIRGEVVINFQNEPLKRRFFFIKSEILSPNSTPGVGWGLGGGEGCEGGHQFRT